MQCIILLILFSIQFSSCSDDTLTNYKINPSTIESLEGYINGPLPDSTIVRADMTKETFNFIAGEDTVHRDQMMNFLLSEPPAQLLWDFRSLLPGTGFSMSDSEAKGNYAFLNTYNIPNGHNNGLIFKADTAEISFLQVGNFYMRYIYADRGLNVSGTGFSISLTDTLKYNYFLNIGEGFNTFHVKAKKITEHFKEYDFISGEPSNAEWFLILYF